MSDQVAFPPSSGGLVATQNVAAELERTRSALAGLAQDLRSHWAGALEVGDFRTVDRLVEASHAVHRALAALSRGASVPSQIDLRDASPS